MSKMSLNLLVRIMVLGLLATGTTALKAVAQLGGDNDFEFVSIPSHARLTGLGGVNITSSDRDPNMFLANPALLTDSTDRFVSASHHAFYADIAQNQLAYNAILGPGTWGVAFQQLSYGSINAYDPTGAPMGTFTSRDFIFTMGYAHRISVFQLGANLKFVQSNLASYAASGLLFDIGGLFIHPEKDLKAGITISNVGFAFETYLPQQTFSMPLDVRAGMSFKPDKMPFRLSFTLHQLQDFLQIAYDDPAGNGGEDAFGQPTEEKITFADKLSRHMVIGGEIVMGKNLNFRLGYNFLQRRELSIEQRRGGAGFSVGAMLRINRIDVAYSRSIQHVAGGTNNFTVTLNTKSLIKKKKVVDDPL